MQGEIHIIQLVPSGAVVNIAEESLPFISGCSVALPKFGFD